MSATFACPHCGATYPRKPVLVGRTVRCTTCKNAFSLREDGIADKVETARVPEATVPPSGPLAQAPARPPLVPLTLPPELAAVPPIGSAKAIIDHAVVEVVEPEAPASAPRPPPRPAPATGSGHIDRFTTQQQEARRAMAATLASSMTAALKAESVKRDVEASEKAKRIADTPEGRVGKIGPVILTGEGVQQAKLRRTWFLIAILLIGVVGGCGWLVNHRSPPRQALEHYAAVVEGSRNRFDRIQAIQERAWLVAVPPASIGLPAMMDMADARIGKARTVKLAAVKPLFAQLKDFALSDRAMAWVPKERLEAVEAAIVPGQRERDMLVALGRLEKRIIPYRDWQESLVAAGLGKDDVDVIDLLLRGKTTRAGENDIAARFVAGDLPDALELAAFAGRKGSMVVSRGQNYELKPVSYNGQLLRFVGKDWPGEWKVLTLSTALITD